MKSKSSVVLVVSLLVTVAALSRLYTEHQKVLELEAEVGSAYELMRREHADYHRDIVAMLSSLDRLKAELEGERSKTSEAGS